MRYIISSNRGERLALADDKKEAREIARHYISLGHVVMLYFANDDGTMLGYSSQDTAAVNRP